MNGQMGPQGVDPLQAMYQQYVQQAIQAGQQPLPFEQWVMQQQQQGQQPPQGGMDPSMMAQALRGG